MQHLDYLADRAKFVVAHLQPVVEGHGELLADLLARHLEDIRVRHQDFLQATASVFILDFMIYDLFGSVVGSIPIRGTFLN